MWLRLKAHKDPSSYPPILGFQGIVSTVHRTTIIAGWLQLAAGLQETLWGVGRVVSARSQQVLRPSSGPAGQGRAGRAPCS